MKGWAIIKHSVFQIIGNKDEAIRITAVLYTVQVLASLYMMSRFGNPSNPAEIMGSGTGFTIFLNAVIGLVTSLWIAIAWHRFILNEESTPGYLPTFHKDRMLAFLGRSFLMILVMIIPIALILSVLVFLAGTFGINIGGALSIFVTVPVLYIFYRLSPVLPGAALGEKISLRQAWASTRGATGALIIVTLPTVLFNILAFAFNPDPLSGLSVISVLWTVIGGWIILMFSISVVTTIYGHYVEGRDLVA